MSEPIFNEEIYVMLIIFLELIEDGPPGLIDENGNMVITIDDDLDSLYD